MLQLVSVNHYYLPFVYVTFKISATVFPITHLITSRVYTEIFCDISPSQLLARV